MTKIPTMYSQSKHINYEMEFITRTQAILTIENKERPSTHKEIWKLMKDH